MKLRDAHSSDLPALAAIHSLCFCYEAWDAASLADLLSAAGTFTLVDDACGGFIMARVAGDEAEVLTLAVLPAARRRGLALGLVTEASRRVSDAGACVMFLEVGVANNPAIALYKKLGFAEVGRRKEYYAGPHGMREDALVLKTEVPLVRVGIPLQFG